MGTTRFVELVAILCCALISTSNGQQQQPQQVHIDILYESLCPDSLDFIANQFYPAYDDIAPYVNVNFVPFGKSANVDGKEFICQHGPKECMGNKIQSCALDMLKTTQKSQAHFVNCYMNTFKKSRSDDNEFGQSCVFEIGLKWEVIKDCYDNGNGTTLQLEAEKQTLSFKPSFVPTIIYDGVFDQASQDDSLSDFHKVVCQKIQSNYPEACQSPSVLRL